MKIFKKIMTCAAVAAMIPLCLQAQQRQVMDTLEGNAFIAAVKIGVNEDAPDMTAIRAAGSALSPEQKIEILQDQQRQVDKALKMLNEKKGEVTNLVTIESIVNGAALVSVVVATLGLTATFIIGPKKVFKIGMYAVLSAFGLTVGAEAMTKRVELTNEEVDGLRKQYEDAKNILEIAMQSVLIEADLAEALKSSNLN